MINENLLREHAPGYIICLSSDCPLRERCLRWQVGQLPDEQPRLLTIVNTLHAENNNSNCAYYRDVKPVRVAIGMVHFFYDMPHHTELAIKDSIIRHFTRTRFYKMRKGDVPITPDDQTVITSICRKHGWTASPAYDRYEERYLW